MNLQHIKEALEYSNGTHSVGDIVDGVLAGELGLLENEGATMIWELIHFPRKSVINIFLAAGNLDDVHRLGDDIEDIAKRLGVKDITLYGRAGWEKALAARGYKKHCIKLVRHLNG